MESEPLDQLHWEAFCYFSEEMAPEEAAIFEEKLASCQDARDALAAVVGMDQAAFHACREIEHDHQLVSVAGRQNTAARMLWMTVGAVACLIVVVATHSYLSDSTRRPTASTEEDGHSNTPAETGELATRWIKARSVQDDRWLEETAQLEELPVEANIDADDSWDVSAPEWMLAAVSGMRDAEDMMDEKNRLPAREE